MPEQSTRSIVIDAPAEAIMSVIADIGAYPDWVGAVRRAEVLQTDDAGMVREARFTLNAGPVKDVYTLRYDWAADGLSVRWELTQGQLQKAQHGQYLLRPLEDGARTEVTYTLSVALVVPLIKMLRRKAERVIMDTALGELKRRAEGGD